MTVSWKDILPAANPEVIGEIEVVVNSKAPGPGGVARGPVTVSLTPPPAILDNKSWVKTVGGLTTGDEVTSVVVTVYPTGNLRRPMATDTKAPNALLVP